MAHVDFTANQLKTADPPLAARFESEIEDAFLEWPGAVRCRIQVSRAGDSALERIEVVVVEDEGVFEWTMSPPVEKGDVRRAAQSALAGRRQGSERRQGSRAVDRRSP